MIGGIDPIWRCVNAHWCVLFTNLGSNIYYYCKVLKIKRSVFVESKIGR